MPNEAGINQFAGLPGPGNVEQPYGAAARMAGLQREAPMSGAPVATSALRTPQRDGSAARSRKVQGAVAGAQAGPVAEPTPPSYRDQLVQALGEVSQVPGIDPLLGEYLQRAQRG